MSEQEIFSDYRTSDFGSLDEPSSQELPLVPQWSGVSPRSEHWALGSLRLTARHWQPDHGGAINGRIFAVMQELRDAGKWRPSNLIELLSPILAWDDIRERVLEQLPAVSALKKLAFGADWISSRIGSDDTHFSADASGPADMAPSSSDTNGSSITAWDATPPTQSATAEASNSSTTNQSIAVTTDKSDYAPGSTAIFNVSGIDIGATVTFNISDTSTNPGIDGDADTYPSFSVIDGSSSDLDGTSNGHISANWQVPADGSATGATLNLIVTSNGLSASTTFTDAPNRIVLENQKPGTPSSYWNVDHSDQIEGFTTDISTNAGGTVEFKINVNGSQAQTLPYKLEIFRLGYYGGDGATLVATINNADGTVQPDALYDATRGLKDAGNWLVTDTWQVPADAVSGVYLARVQRLDSNGNPIDGAVNQIPFIVRNDGAYSDIVLQTSDTTWQTYNAWWGNNGQIGANMYGDASGTIDNPNVADPGGGAQDRAYAVSYNRPYLTRDPNSPAAGGRDYLFGADFAAIMWLEQNGYDVSYMSGVDSDRLGTSWFQDGQGGLLHKAYISVGHDEYWSGTQRLNVEAARDAGVNLLFWGGNDVYWKIRYEDSIDASSTDYRTLVTYKETWANGNPSALPQDYANIDPSNEWTGTWRDTRFLTAVDSQGNLIATGARPENSLTGQLFLGDGNIEGAALDVPANYTSLRYWRGTEVANGNGTFDIAPGIIGYEWNTVVDDANRPAGLIKLSETIIDWPKMLVDQGNRTQPGTGTHSLSIYRDDSGALVFAAGTVFWTWGLSDEHGTDPYYVAVANTTLQQFTVNMFADMGIQPQTLAVTLQLATASTDHTSASVTMQDLPSLVRALSPLTISGTATDIDGSPSTTDGVVALVEVSFDGGQTWRPAQGTSNWTFQWTPTQVGTYQIMARAIDDSLNIPTTISLPSDSVTVAPPANVGLFSVLETPPGLLGNDNTSLELGTKFIADEAGVVTALRYYRAAGDANDTDVREGHLWSSNGTLLATVTFNSTPGQFGWQTAVLSAPVQIAANETYIVSYHTENNYYATGNFFNTPYAEPFGYLTSPSSPYPTSSGLNGNGLFAVGQGALFPNTTYGNANYWADIVFVPAVSLTLFDTNSAANSISENASIGTTVGITALENVAGDVTYSLANSLGGIFAIDPVSGVVTLAGAIDREAVGGSVTVIVSATSSSGTSLATFNINVGDVDEFDVGVVTDVDADLNGTWLNAPVGASIGLTARAVDADATSNGITYSLLDNAGDRFSINASTGAISVANQSLLNELTTYQITVQALSLDGSTSTGTFAVPVAAVPSRISLFDQQTAVTSAMFNDGASLELGVKFQSDIGGILTALKYWRSAADAADTDVRQGHVWDTNGNLLGTATFNSAPGAIGWQVATLTTPLVLTANSTYVASYHTDNNYVAQGNYFASPYTSVYGTLSAPGGPIANGVFAYGSGSIFPTNAFSNANYWVDVNFTPMDPSEFVDGNAAPDAVLENSAVGSDVGLTVQATGLSGASYSLVNDGGGRFVIDPITGVVSLAQVIDRETSPATVSIVVSANSSSGSALGVFQIAVLDVDEFDVGSIIDANAAANGVWRLAPVGKLVGIKAFAEDGDGTNNSIAYSLLDDAGGRFAINATTGEVSVAASGLIDQVGNHQITVLATSADGSSSQQSFLVPISEIPLTTSLFDQEAVVAGSLFNDGSPIEIGVKFQATLEGSITGIRYYRAAGDAGDTDVRSGHLWDAAGNLLATVTFNSAPGQSGWQIATLSNPVVAQVGATYIASYQTSNNYFAQPGFFSQPFNGVYGTLSAPAGENGVFGVGTGLTVPANSFGSTNYWVDVSFTSELPPPVSIGLSQDSGTTGDLLTNNAGISGTTTPGATVNLTIDGVVGAATVTADAGTGAWSYVPSGFAQGPHTVVASVTSSSNNLTGTASLTFTLDTVAPSVAFTSTGGPTVQQSHIVEGTGEVGAIVTLFEGTTQMAPSATIGTSGAWSIPITFATVGSHIITASIVDGAANTAMSATDLNYFYFINTDPSITGGDAAAYSMQENATLVATLSAIENDPGQSVTYSVSGGQDGSRFEIRNGNQLHFVTAPDFELPGDGGSDNVYDLVISASDGAGGIDTQSIAVTVTDQLGLTIVSNAPTITGGTEADTLTGQGSANALLGLGGNDSLSGAGANDTLTGGAGNDTLVGGTGTDWAVFSGSIDDYAFSFNSGTQFVDTRTGSPDGTDRLTTIEFVQFSDITARLFAGSTAGNSLAGTNSLTQADLLLGFDGNDLLNGGSGDDILVGGLQRDTLTGGAGADRFVFQNFTESGTAATTRDIITDFVTTSVNATTHDVIDLSDIDASSVLAGDQAFAWGGTTSTANGVWYQVTGSGLTAVTTVSGDVNGDLIADFQIQLSLVTSLAVSDFRL